MLLTEIPLGLPGRVYRSPMPYSLYDHDGEVLKAYSDHHVSVVVQLVSDQEGLKRSGHDLRSLYARHGIDVLYLPTPDFGIPEQARFEKIQAMAIRDAQAARNIVVHCYAGIGRTGLFLACMAGNVLTLNGEEAVKWVRRLIPGAVEVPEQIDFVHQFLDGRA